MCVVCSKEQVCPVSLRGEERDSENASFDSATALHFWSVKQLSKIA